MNSLIVTTVIGLTLCTTIGLVGVAVIINCSLKRMTDKHFINNVIHAIRLYDKKD